VDMWLRFLDGQPSLSRQRPGKVRVAAVMNRPGFAGG
jgi:hypothetical protein